MCGPAGFHPNIWPDHEIYKYGFARNLPWMFTHAGSPENTSELKFLSALLNWGELRLFRGHVLGQQHKFWAWCNMTVCAAYSACPPFTGTLVSSPTKEKVSKYCRCRSLWDRHLLVHTTRSRLAQCLQLNGPWPWFWQCSVEKKTSFQAWLHIFIYWGPPSTLTKLIADLWKSISYIIQTKSLLALAFP